MPVIFKQVIIPVFFLCLIQTITCAQEKKTPDKQANNSIVKSAVSLYKKGNKTEAEQLLTDYIQNTDYNNESQRSIIYQSYLTLVI